MADRPATEHAHSFVCISCGYPEAAQGAAPRRFAALMETDALADDRFGSEGAAPRAEGPPDDRTCLTHPRQVAHDWHHQSYEGTWLCHCTVCGIVPNRAAPRVEGPQPIDADMIAAALEVTLERYDAGIGWAPGSGYDHGNPPTVDQIARGIAARLPL